MKYKYSNKIFNDLIINAKQYFFKEDNKVLFEKRNIVKVVEFNNKKFVFKYFKIPHIINKIVYRFFRDSKAKRSYDNSIKLKELNINTHEAIAYIEYNSLFLFKESFYISNFFDYSYEIRAVLKDKNFKNRDTIFQKFIEFTYDLHNKGVYHIDYSPGNVLIKEYDGEYEFSIIDVNRMKFLDFDIDLRMKSMSKITKNMEDNKLFIKYYSYISGYEINLLNDKLVYFVNEHQKYLENKKKIKQIKK